MSRLTSQPSKFFKIIRTIGLALGAIAGVIATAPIALPAAVVTAAGYITFASAAAAAVAHTANENE